MVDPAGTPFTASWMVVKCMTFATQVPTATTDAVNCCALRPAKVVMIAASMTLRHTPIVLVTRPPLHRGGKNTTEVYLVTVKNCSVPKRNQAQRIRSRLNAAVRPAPSPQYILVVDE